MALLLHEAPKQIKGAGYASKAHKVLVVKFAPRTLK